MAKEKDRSQRLHERHQIILADMLRLEENKYCADCNAKGPRWASWNLGVFICIRCAGIHRNLGVHISRVKSVNLDSWTQEQIESIQFKGNGKGREMYECHLPPGFKRPQDDYAVETFIRSKYVRKLYISKNTNDTVKPTSVSAKQETSPVQTSPSKSSSKSKKSSQAITVTPKPRTKPVKPVPSPSKPSPSSITSPTLDLLTDQPMINDQTKPLDQPLMGDLNPPTRVVKDSIMSLYDVQPGYNAQGYPVGSMYQQQMNAMHYQQQQWQKQQYQQWQQQQVKSQVDEVQRQMSRLRVGQQQHDSTLNPHLW